MSIENVSNEKKGNGVSAYVMLSLPTDEEINKISYQMLSDVAISSNSDRKVERAVFIHLVTYHRDEILRLIKKSNGV